MSADVIEHLRSRERAAYEAWRATPVGALELSERSAAWHRALLALNEEMNARARAALELAVRTSGEGVTRAR